LKTVIIVGGLPPPIGGVTVHIQRLHDYMDKCGVDHFVISQFNSSIKKNVKILRGIRILKFFQLLYLIKKLDGEIVHVHASYFVNLIYGGLFFKLIAPSKKFILTIHSGLFKMPNKFHPKYFIYLKILSSFDYIICINESQRTFFKEALNYSNKRLPIIPSYITVQNIESKITSRTVDLYNSLRREVKYILFCTGFLNEIYGFDILLDAINTITDINIGLLFVYYTGINREYEKKLKSKIKSNLNIRQLYNVSSDDFLFLLKNSDLLIRPSRSDSYGTVIPDALFFGVPAVASDVCPRHEGTILFKNENVNDLRMKIIEALSNYSIVKKKAEKLKIKNFASDLIEFYRNI
jgi:glycosyltransferase involved in cell wall biosynthesis